MSRFRFWFGAAAVGVMCAAALGVAHAALTLQVLVGAACGAALGRWRSRFTDTYRAAAANLFDRAEPGSVLHGRTFGHAKGK